MKKVDDMYISMFKFENTFFKAEKRKNLKRFFYLKIIYGKKKLCSYFIFFYFQYKSSPSP